MSDESNRLYRLMIYFAHSTFVFYAGAIKYTEMMTPEEFREKNDAVCIRVADEAMGIMNYELSDWQMGLAIISYLRARRFPQDLSKPAYTHKKING